MARRSKDEGCLSNLFDTFIAGPWWLPFPLALVAFLVTRFLFPLLFGDPVWVAVKTLCIASAPYIAGVVLLVGSGTWLVRLIKWGVSPHREQQPAPRISHRPPPLPPRPNEPLVKTVNSLDAIRALDWQQFEHLVAEAYRRLGYQVRLTGGAKPDGGVDIILKKDGLCIYVQCKQWQAWKVGVKVIRELYGVMASDHIDAGIVVTCGEFTAEAIIFAENKPLQLVDGVDLLPLIQTTGFGMTTSPPAPPVIASPLTSSVPPALPLPTHGQQITHVSTHVLLPPTCPRCGSVMVARTARRGSNAGEQFWGCPDYPKCKGLREMQ